MPFYEYICESCEFHFEVFQKMSDPPKTECPECGKPVRKVIFAPPIILRGSGFYETEYGRSQHNNPDRKDSGSSGSGENALNSPTKSEGGSESKPVPLSESSSKPSSESSTASSSASSSGSSGSSGNSST